MDQEECRMLADILEKYQQMHMLTVVLDGIPEKKYREGMNKLQKKIDKLRKGKWKGIIKKSMVPYVKGQLEGYMRAEIENGPGNGVLY